MPTQVTIFLSGTDVTCQNISLNLISLFLFSKGQKYEISEEDVNEYEKIMRLTIKSWQKADESHFTCISTNSLGKADGKIQAYSKFLYLIQ